MDITNIETMPLAASLKNEIFKFFIFKRENCQKSLSLLLKYWKRVDLNILFEIVSRNYITMSLRASFVFL